MAQELKTKTTPEIGCLWVTLDDLGVPPTNGWESLFDKGMLSGYTAGQDVQD